MLLQEARRQLRPRCHVDQMSWLGKAVVIDLFIMSAWSIGVMIDRLIAYNARPQAVASVRSGRGRRAA